MLPKVVIHNSVSLDGSLTGFEPDMTGHYQIAREYEPQVHLVGSNTMKTGAEMFGSPIKPEEETDFEKPKRDPALAYWAVIDSKGILEKVLHTCRRLEYCRDIVVLVSEKTPKTYRNFLEERNYDYHVVGRDSVDLRLALEVLSRSYEAKTVLTDTGRILGNLLLEQGLVSEVSLLVHPIVVGENAYGMFGSISQNIKLKLLKQEPRGKGLVWLTYNVVKE
ncbi:MAG: dihydrofolate reductase family protein [Candidatus Bathyarchaeota archaeon]|nr:dihydrofolate reductase family protein [Candidatus Bathyarchaeota archaeon]